MTRIAIIGMACRYPDASSPSQLWENALAGRRAFRRIPEVRMRLEDYWSADPAAPDRFYTRNAAVIEGYEFDRVGYKIAGSTYRSTDLTHWLALDVASQALADAGFSGGEGLPRERTSVIVGNSLTGEFVRAGQLRLRWPYVRRTVAAALQGKGWPDEELAEFLTDLEQTYKRPFPPVDEDSLAGSLSNTIAGRICNHFDLKGGGYTVDGACSSSLLSVATAAKALVDGEVDVAVAGGVDLSIDPFEIVGFAKTGALAKTEMLVYDRGSNGFWPGEGCGMVVLMREDEAQAAGHRVYANVVGWGISSDGKGGITRPEVSGYQLALRRAYERAGFGVDTVPMFEGHGTGTAVGDTTELTALTLSRRDADPAAPPAAIGSIKAMIGHTKAAAGVAGLIKAAMAVYHQVLPPTLGCVDAHAELCTDRPALRMLRKAEPWPAGAPVRAGITAMGFGGINTHVVLDGSAARRPRSMDARTRAVSASVQDAELLLFDADSADQLRVKLVAAADFVPRLAYAQLADLAATLQRGLADRSHRAALVVISPDDAEHRLGQAIAALDEGQTALVDAQSRVFLGRPHGPARLGYLFPGQGSGRGTSGGALRRRFDVVDEVYVWAELPTDGDTIATAVAQPRIVTGSMAALRALSALGMAANVAVGHSLGEITALHWAGVMDDDALLRVARMRGQTMTEHTRTGAMAAIGASAEAVALLLADEPVVIAGYNGPRHTVVAGPTDAVKRIGRKAGEASLDWMLLAVSHAFHSPLVAPAADTFASRLAKERFARPCRRIVSTVIGEDLAPDADLVSLLRSQITEPVLFAQALALAADGVDLLVEVGPGRALAGLARHITEVPAVAIDTDNESLAGLLCVVGAAHVVGVPVATDVLFDNRLVHPLRVGEQFSFLANPCEQAPRIDVAEVVATTTTAAASAAPAGAPGQQSQESSVELLRRLAAERAELPVDSVREDSRLLDDMHLSSITVGQIMNQAAKVLGLPVSAPTNFATATVRELADALDELGRTALSGDTAPMVAGAQTWVRAFATDLVRQPLPARGAAQPNGRWLVSAGGHPLAEPLRQAMQDAGLGDGILAWLPADSTMANLESALTAAQAAVAGDRFVLVQQGPVGASLAKTLHLEMPGVRTTIVHLPAEPDAGLVQRIVAEVAVTDRFSEVVYDRDGLRRVPTLRALPVQPAEAGDQPLGSDDVLLVTGGGKGITAECALALAADSGAGLAIVGRSDPEQDSELAGNLARMAAAGVRVRYARSDVTDGHRLRAAVAEVEAELGPVTAVLHGAGINDPGPLAGLDMDAVRRAFAPKIDGLHAVLSAVDPARLRVLLTFGSIIGRGGLRGEAAYAMANERLAALTVEVAGAYPNCRGLCLEWSVWSGVGMGERLSVVESLNRDGVTPIPPDQGVGILRRLLADGHAPTVVVVSGRTGGLPTLRYERPELPLLRFVEQPLVHYQGVELVSQVDLSTGSDPYLDDHELDGNLLFPAVIGMEAMAQVASAALGRPGVPVIEHAEFSRPIVVPVGGTNTIQIAATVTAADEVKVVIRTGDTGFAADHFRATLRYLDGPVPAGPPEVTSAGLAPVPIEPLRDLYGGLLFQGKRFQRVLRYGRTAARHADADIALQDDQQWFSAFLPSELLLGDPGMRDALIHAGQVCVPDTALLPAGVERIYPAGDAIADCSEVTYSAVERERREGTYVYDIAVRKAGGAVVERWEGLRLQAIRKLGAGGPWVVPLLGPFLERAVGDRLGVTIAVAVEPDGTAGDNDRRAQTTVALSRALSRPIQVRYRPDGRPEVDGQGCVSAAHGAGVTLAVAGAGPLACDVEPVAARTAGEWAGLLGGHAPLADLIARHTGEPADIAATRVWSAIECLAKAGVSTTGPLTLEPGTEGDGWTGLAAGELRIATFVTRLQADAESVTFAILAQPEE